MFGDPKKAALIQSLDVDQTVDILKALAHPVRLRIVIGLLTQACSVNHMAECLHISQPVVSQQLRILRQTGILKQTRIGKQVFYDLANEDVKRVIHCLFPQF